MAEVYDIELPPDIAKVLVSIVGLAEEKGVLSLTYVFTEMHSRESDMHTFKVGIKSVEFADIRENPAFCLEAMGFIQTRATRSGAYNIFLTQQAFKWTKYRRKGRLGRAIYRWWRLGKSGFAVFWAALITLITVALTILQIYQILWP